MTSETGRPTTSGRPQLPALANRADRTSPNRQPIVITPDMLTERVMARFWSRVRLPAELDGCAVWLGYLSSRGYGHFSLGGRHVLAHRVAVMWATGEDIPPGLVCDHLCRVRSCVAVSHIELITKAENTARGNGPTAAALRALVGRGECLKGHDLTLPNSWLVKAGGRRRCRECAYEQTRKWRTENAEKLRGYRRQRRARQLAERNGMLFDLPGGAP